MGHIPAGDTLLAATCLTLQSTKSSALVANRGGIVQKEVTRAPSGVIRVGIRRCWGPRRLHFAIVMMGNLGDVVGLLLGPKGRILAVPHSRAARATSGTGPWLGMDLAAGTENAH